MKQLEGRRRHIWKQTFKFRKPHFGDFRSGTKNNIFVSKNMIPKIRKCLFGRKEFAVLATR